MQILFDEKLISELRDRYIILELDTVMHKGMAKPLTLYAVVEYPSIQHFENLSNIVKQHADMIKNYKLGIWDTAIFQCYALKGSWLGELDEFYELVISSCNEMRDSNTVWTGVKYTMPLE